MANASNKSHTVATRPEQVGKGTENPLISMQKSIIESVRREIQPVRQLLQDLSLCQQQSRSLAAQRDILLVELMKMHAPSCEPTVQAGELPYTVDPSNASIENASPEFWKNRIAMPSINEQSQDEARKHKNSLTDVMVASDTEEESDSYEPSDVLTDCLDDEVAQRTSGSMIHHQVKSADHTVPADTLGREKPQRHAMWDVQATECKQYDKSASDWVGYRVGDHVAVGTNADGQKKKRQRTEE